MLSPNFILTETASRVSFYPAFEFAQFIILYQSVFFGLSLRQCVFSLLAVVVAVGLYFLLKPCVGTETVSWMCVLGAAPFAALGFFTYHGMTAEQFLWAWLRSELLEPKKLRFESSTLYRDILKPSMDKREKEEYKRHD